MPAIAKPTANHPFKMRSFYMSRLTILLTGIIGSIVCSSCGFKARNVLMVPRIDEPGVVKLYYDREGYLYPPEAHVTPHYFYLLHHRQVSRNQSNPEFATIEYALRKNDSLNNVFIHQRYNLALSDTTERFFLRLQRILRQQAIEKIRQAMSNMSATEVVFLIHGFNDPAPDAYYFSLRRSVNSFLVKPPVYVEVFWDGLTDLGSGTATPFIWQKARLNSAKVGLGLRSLLRGIDSDTKITFLTHSLGASVATHALFNPTIWPKDFQEKLETDYKSTILSTPAQKQLQIGMLAPAISGTEIFAGISNTVPEGQPLRLKRVVIGYNPYDYAVTKGGLFPKMFGNTALGADAGGEVEKTTRLIQEKNPDIYCRAIDFSFSLPDSIKSKMNKKAMRTFRQSEHAILFYQNNPNFGNFLYSLFGNIDKQLTVARTKVD
jgi:hypothetical protein